VIETVKIYRFWDKYHLKWQNLDPQVNILVGINGCGKTTLLNLMYKRLNGIATNLDMPLEGTVNQCVMISTFDIASDSDTQGKSPLDIKLEHLVFKKEETSFSYLDMHLMRLDSAIERFHTIANSFFEDTGKTVFYDVQTRSLKVRKDDITLSLTQLSAGEKQLLIILLEILLIRSESVLILMDEPELSLHIRWQRKLIPQLIRLQPNAQFIIATHAPSVFGDGYMDKLCKMEEFFEPNLF
jgi:predicted ATPase